MAELRQAISAGYRDPDAYRTEDALSPLSDRDEFKKLLAGLNKERAPKAENNP